MGITELKSNEQDGQNEISLNNETIKNSVDVIILMAISVIPLIIVPLGGNFDHYYFPKVIAMAVLVISFIVMMITKKQSLKYIIENDWINRVLFIYLILLFVSVFFAGNKELSILGSPGRCEGIITLTMYMMFFIIARSFSKLDDKFFVIVLCTAALVAIYGILQSVGIDPIPRNERTKDWVSSAFSTMGNPNFLGSYLVLVIPISMYLYVLKKNYFGLVSYSVLFYCLLCTNTRGAWLGAIVSILSFVGLHKIYYMFTKKELKRYFLLFFITMFIVLFFNYNTGGALAKRFFSISNDAVEFLSDGERADYTGSYRGFIWKRVIELIKKRPLFGYGIENLGEAFVKYYSKDMIEFWGEVRYPDKAHNEYLHIAVTSGIPSLIAYLTFVTLIIKKSMKKINNNIIVILLFSSVIGYLTTAFFNISVVSVAYVYWIFLGLLAGNFAT